ncbi:gluconate:H+ symporter [Loigolactobacillus coryniformis]|uniref:gluconate:H+ symporter n=1 Tax=Loigolactobacillus coryniformis TaxID=1610 RepID=UPI0023424B06|nr:gluconate:H+ symporter [Loigolactobacillus coryniformis]MDC4186042.1 gluconate:H+ symporter [Loigolactobacillus coryniformis]
MPFISVTIGVLLLLVLMMAFKMNAFISLILSSLAVGLLEGMSPVDVMTSIQNGLGSSAGNLMLVIIFGAAVGKLLTDTGGAQRIALTMVHTFGKKHVQAAAVITAIIVGIAMFFETGVVVLIPLVFSIAMVAEVPILYIGLPVIAALITMHGFVPPHPGPTAVANIFHANIGKTLMLGLPIAIPSIIIAGPLYTKLFKKDFLEVEIPKALYTEKKFTESEMPSFFLSILSATLPIIFIFIKTIVELIWPNSGLRTITDFIGNAGTALLITLIVSLFTLGFSRGRHIKELMDSFSSAVSGIAMILLIIAGGGAFKQVLIDSHIDKYIANLMEGSAISPLVLTWLIAAVLRVSLGSATVAGMTAAGIVAPVVVATGVSPELMTLAAGAGSVGFSHVNDAGFWIIKEYFNMSLIKTFKTWTVLTSIIAIVGLAGVMLFSLFI